VRRSTLADTCRNTAGADASFPGGQRSDNAQWRAGSNKDCGCLQEGLINNSFSPLEQDVMTNEPASLKQQKAVLKICVYTP